jgi:diguanylate cyclase (GGDEF)-like protein
VQNFYVALCEREHPDTFSFPYEVDEHDSYRGSVRQLSGSLTASVARRGEPLLVDRVRYDELAAAGEIERYGAPPASWLGVPLILDEVVIGVVAVQSYADNKLYTQKDIEIMQFVSKQIAVAIERKRAEQALLESREYLRYMAHHDPLTHLPNRVLFYDRLKYAITQARRYKREVALLFLDLDGFKAVNDTLGHDIGDMLLQEVAHRLSACVRESDTVARMGGDEFTTILPDIYQREDATIVAQKILASLVQPFIIAGHSLSVTASIGLSLYPSDTTDMEELIRQADHAMYHAKESGKNQYYWAGAK